MRKALITDGVHESLLKGLEAIGFKCDYHPKITLEEVRKIIHQYEGVIINSKILADRTFLDNAIQLKFIGRLGSGLEIIDLDYAKEKGVAVLNAPEGNRNAVAEQALGMLLSLLNNLRQADAQVRQKIWRREDNRGYELMGQTVGIIGFGHTGRQFAKKLMGMGVRVLAYDKYKKNYIEKDTDYIIETDLETIFKEADILSLHLPLTDETKHWIDEDAISRFHKNIILLNTSRGNVVRTADIITALEAGKVKGACLDVFENEKVQTFTEEEHKLYERLYALDNVILTPHIAGWTFESKRRLATVLLNKIRSILINDESLNEN